MSSDFKKPFVLIVSNNAEQAGRLIQLLEERYTTETALSHEEALRKIKQHPDILLISSQESVQSAITFCEAFKRSPSTEKIPRLLIIPSEKERSTPVSEDIADIILNEPFSSEELWSALKTLLKLKTAERTLRANTIQNLIFLNSTPTLVFLKDESLRYIWINHAYEKFLGKKRKDIIGRTDFELMMDESLAKQCRKSDEEALKKGRMVSFIERTDENWFETLKFPVPLLNGKTGVGGFVWDITTFKTTENELKVRESLFRTSLYSIGDAVITTDRQGRIMHMNPVAEELTGWKEAEAKNRKIDEVFCIVNEETRQTVENPVERVLSEGTVVGLANHTLLLAKDGREIPVADSGAPIRSDENDIMGVVLVFRDQTRERNFLKEIQEREIKIRESQLLLKEILDTIPVRVFWKDRNSIYLGCNKPFAMDAGLKNPEEMIGKTDYDMGWAEQAELYRHDDKEVIESGIPKLQYEEPQTTPDGGTIWLKTSKVPLRNTANEIIGVLGTYEDITEKKKTELALQKSEKNFRRTLDESPFGIRIVSSDGITKYVNQEFLNVFGFESFDDYLAAPIKSYYTEKSLLEHEQRKLARKSDKYAQEEYEVEIIRKDGKSRTLQVYRKGVFWDGEMHELVIYQDITFRKQAEEKLRLLGKSVEQSPVCIIIVDRYGRIEYVNPAFTMTTGYSQEETLGMNPRILKSGYHSKEFYKNLWETILSGKDWVGEFYNKKKNGQFYWESTIISPVADEKGTITHFVAIKEDITAQKKITEELILAKEKAEESDRLKSAFLANLSHEIRTPMNAIMGFSQLLEAESYGQEKKHEFVEIIQKSGQYLLSVIDDIIEISRIETRQITPTLTRVNINQLMHLLHERLQITIPEEKEIRLLCESDDEGRNVFIETDEVKLQQILTNLISNGIKYTEQGFVKFGYRITGNEEIEFYVEDTGIGIDPKYHNRIFDRFGRVEGDVAVRKGGLGLGLAIAKAYTELLGGTIRLESEPGKGSLFTVFLPCKIHTESISKESDMRFSHAPGELKLKILIAEDDDVNFIYLRELFSAGNYTVLRASTGREAVDICRQNNDIDLVLMDIKMPGMTGTEALKEIRKQCPSLPVIAQTAYAMSGDEQRILKEGFDGYIAKPLTSEKLMETIKTVLKKKKML